MSTLHCLHLKLLLNTKLPQLTPLKGDEGCEEMWACCKKPVENEGCGWRYTCCQMDMGKSRDFRKSKMLQEF